MTDHRRKLVRLLDDARSGESLKLEEIGFLLELEEAADLELLFAAARDVRERHFGREVFLYGFLYFSTHCRNNCTLDRKSTRLNSSHPIPSRMPSSA